MRLKIKHPKAKQHRLPSAIGQLIQKFTNHREVASSLLAYMSPSISAEEHSEASYLAEAIFTELEKKHGTRMKMIVPIFMYERTVGGIVGYWERERGVLNDEKSSNDRNGLNVPDVLPDASAGSGEPKPAGPIDESSELTAEAYAAILQDNSGRGVCAPAGSTEPDPDVPSVPDVE